MFVAGFVGSPAMNLLEGGLLLPPAARPTAAGDGSVTLGIRPHDVEIVAPGTGDTDARVDVAEPRGSELLLHLRLGADGGGAEVRVVAPPEPSVPVDAVVGLRCDRQRLHWFDSRSGRRLD